MKKMIIGFIILAVIVGGFFAFSKPSTNSTAGAVLAASTKISRFSQVQTAIDKNGQLLDVRTPDEYNAGHIDGASNLSLQDLEAGKLPSGTKNQALFVYCHSGNRSRQATTILKASGYTNVTDLGAITHIEAIGGKLI